MVTRISIKQSGPPGSYRFEVDEPDAPGSPPVGRGATVNAALGAWLRAHAERLNIQIDVDPQLEQSLQRAYIRQVNKYR